MKSILVIRRPAVMSLVAISVWLIVSACSPTTRHRLLTFFFDGVPSPHNPNAGTDQPLDSQIQPGAQAQDKPAARVPRKLYVHPPFRENRCGSCHDPQTGQLFRPVTEGLCVSCHRSVTEAYAYLHGPVAANACLHCHHYHSSTYEHILLDNSRSLCFSCHDQQKIESAPHHVLATDQTCTDCHNPHGGDNRFFLTNGGT